MRGRRATKILAVFVLVMPGAPGASAQDQPMLPAGAQFLAEPEPLPEGFVVRDARDVAEHDGTIVVLGSTDIGARDVGHVAAAVRTPDGTWSMVTVDDLRGYKPPKGVTESDGFLPVAIAAGPDGFVALGKAGFYEYCSSSCAQDGQVGSLMWHSPDGRTWTRIDPREVLGRKTAVLLQAVMATPDGGWMVAGGAASTDFRHPSNIVVLTSPDGLEWRRAATVKSSRSLEATALHQVGGVPVLEGVELVCLRDSVHHSLAGAVSDGDVLTGQVAPLRLWRSDAAGQDWEPIDPNVPGVLKAPGRGLVSRRECADTDFGHRAKLSGSGDILGAAGGGLVAVDADLSRAAVSSDLEHWTIADLPGATPGGDPPGDRGRGAAIVSTEPGSLALLSMEARRDSADDTVIARDRQVLAWSSGDGGATWARLPAGRPVLTGSNGMTQLSSGDVALVEQPGIDGVGALHLSEAGALQPWGTCEPAAGADCVYATIDIDLPGADLSGIDLDGARIGYRDWSGVDLRGASMRHAGFGATLTGADLRDADVVDTALFGDISGARVAGADMRRSRVDIGILAGDTTGTRFEGASFQVPEALPAGIELAGRDLDDASFWGPYTGPGDLRGVDFGDARIDSASFWSVDLTGAKLGDARFKTLSFNDVTCPDGKPMKNGAYGLEACRIKAR